METTGKGWIRLTYIELLILVGMYRSRGEAASSHWDAESGRVIFRATMPLKVFHAFSRMLDLITVSQSQQDM